RFPVRPVTADLALRAGSGQVQRLYEEMSPDNLRMRFFSLNPASALHAAERVASAGDHPGYCALAAEYGGRLVGLAEYEALPGSSTAEISVAVADRWHHRGVGTLLLEHLADAARTAGITAFSADALAENHSVLEVFRDLGLRVVRHFDGPEVHCTVRLAQDENYLSAVDARGRVSDVISLEPLLRPGTVAVIGAGRRPGSVGRAILRNIHNGSFTGRLFAVHPEAAAIAGVRAWRSVALLPRVPDLAVIAVPARAVAEVAEECGRAGVRSLLVVSAGLDRDQGSALLDACRRHGMRLVGPNCLGLANTEEAVHLDATFAARHPGAGTAGVAVQSPHEPVPPLSVGPGELPLG
ncbi:GNAT family N-acetyltransferase, partial [Streptomyces eurythermus]